MRVTLIHNPKAGRQGEDAGSLQNLLREMGHEVRYQSSKDDDWKDALKKPADLVVVAAGDGTVGRIVRRMAGRGVPMALLPSGTANNIARTLGQLQRPFEELVRGWEEARRVKLDVGTVEGPWGKRGFVEGLGLGLFAELLSTPESESGAAKQKTKPVEGALERLKQLALHTEPVEVHALLDGEDISGEYLMFEALNLPYVGPNLRLATDSSPGDGQFEVVMVTDAERDRLVHYFEHWQGNRERLAVLPSRHGQRLQIAWDGAALHIDDKLKPSRNAKPKEMAGMVEAYLEGETVEFLIPA